MKFNYQARSKTGEIQSGVVDALSREAAFAVLRAHGIFVTALEEKVSPFYAKKLKIFQRITKKDIVGFSRQLAIMLKSKVSLTETFRTLARQTKNPNFREIISKVGKDVEGGTPLSKALGSFPKVFSSFFINMVKSGEASGKLSDAFLYLADYLEREYNFRGKIIEAMIYPLFVLLVFSAVAILMIVYILPQLTSVLEETGQQLPLITRLVMALSDFLKSRGWIVILVIIFLAIFIFRYLKSKKGKKVFDRILLKLPLIGPFLRKFYLSRFALNLSTLILGGLPISQALEITSKVVGNEEYKKIIMKTREEVEKGSTISLILAKYPKFISPLFYQMIVIGEKTGTLDSSLKNVVEFYQGDLDRSLDNFVKLLEPIFIIILGIMVGGLAAAVIMPIYSMGFV